MKKEFRLQIELGNEAMQTKEDVSLSLLTIARKLSNGLDNGYIHDLNGNKVGDWWGEFGDENDD